MLLLSAAGRIWAQLLLTVQLNKVLHLCCGPFSIGRRVWQDPLLVMVAGSNGDVTTDVAERSDSKCKLLHTVRQQWDVSDVTATAVMYWHNQHFVASKLL
jgi:hypothetical protein